MKKDLFKLIEMCEMLAETIVLLQEKRTTQKESIEIINEECFSLKGIFRKRVGSTTGEKRIPDRIT